MARGLPLAGTSKALVPTLSICFLALLLAPYVTSTRLGSLSEFESSSGVSIRRQLALFKRCDRSLIKGMTSSTKLTSGLVIHWKATSGSTVSAVVRAKKGAAPAEGWYAVGFSPSSMDGSNVLVWEDGSTLGKYDLSSSDATAATWSFASERLVDGSKYKSIWFTRTAGDGASTPLKTGSNTIAWAYRSGAWSTDANHDDAGTATVDFSCNGCRGIFGRNIC